MSSTRPELSASQSKSDTFYTACNNVHDPGTPCTSTPLSQQPSESCYIEHMVVLTKSNEAYGMLKCTAPPDIKPHEYETVVI